MVRTSHLKLTVFPVLGIGSQQQNNADRHNDDVNEKLNQLVPVVQSVPSLKIAQKGPPAEAPLLASSKMIDKSHSCSLRFLLAGSATKIFPSAVTPRRTKKCPELVKCPFDIKATISLPDASASTTAWGSSVAMLSQERPNPSAAPGISEW
jgi:hypothetical protein